MTKFNSDKINIRNYYIFIFLYFTLLVGFYFDEDSLGGAFRDYLSVKIISQDFANDFLLTLYNYDNYAHRHSPLFTLILGVFEYFKFNDNFVRLLNLHFCLLIPIIFYFCLFEKFKFKKINKWIFIIISSLIFLSPTYRSLSIWPSGSIAGLLFFLISVFFYLRFDNTKERIYCYLNIIFYVVASYFSLNFVLFSVYFFIKYLNYFSIKNITIYNIFVINIILSLPAFYYLFYLDVNFLNKPAILNSNLENIFFSNYFNQILIIPTIFLFYLVPFLYFGILKLKKINAKQIILSLIILFISIYFFDYSYSYTGGGVFFKLSNYFFENNLLFFFTSFIGLIIVINLLSSNINNFILVILIFLSNPQTSIYHKYYDPFLLIIFFSLFNLNTNHGEILNKNKYIFIYLYFTLFLILNLIKTIWKI